MDELAERIENKFINIYNKFDILDKKLNNYYTKFHKIIEMIDLIISDEYTKIYKTYHPVKNFDLIQDRFFPGPQPFCKNQWKGLGVRRIF